MRTVRRLTVLLTSVLLTASSLASPAAHADGCRFTLGFASLHELIPAQIGECVENAAYNPANGDAIQHTTGGMLVWRKLDNWTAFTDGSNTWINGPDGLQERDNTEQFAWEVNPTAQQQPQPTGPDPQPATGVATPAPVAQTAGVLQGHVSVGPLTPVQRPGAPPQASGPVCTTRGLIILGPDNTPVAAPMLASDCTYRVELPAGVYTVTLTPNGLDLSKDLPAHVTITAGATAQLDINIDTGMR